MKKYIKIIIDALIYMAIAFIVIVFSLIFNLPINISDTIRTFLAVGFGWTASRILLERKKIPCASGNDKE